MSESLEGTEITSYKIISIQINGKPYTIEFDHEEDGQIIAEAVDIGISGVIAYGATEEEALQKVQQIIQEALNDGLLT